MHRRLGLHAAELGISTEEPARRILDQAARPSGWAIPSPPSPGRAPPTSGRSHATTHLSRLPIADDHPRHKLYLRTNARGLRPGLIDWLIGQRDAALVATSVTVMDLHIGLQRLPEARRKADHWVVLDFTLSRLIGLRVLLFDMAAAAEAARIAASTEAKGTPIGQAAAQIAAIARTHGFAVATRDEGPFRRAGLTVINPWEPA